MEKAVIWCRLIASFSVVSSVIAFLIPDGGIKKSFQSLLTLIVAFILVQPLSGSDNFTSDFFDAVDYVSYDTEKDIMEYKDIALKTASENQIKSCIENAFSEKGIKCACYASCTVTEDEITIETVTVCGCIDEGKEKHIEKLIRDTVDGDYEIIFSRE